MLLTKARLCKWLLGLIVKAVSCQLSKGLTEISGCGADKKAIYPEYDKNNLAGSDKGCALTIVQLLEII